MLQAKHEACTLDHTFLQITYNNESLTIDKVKGENTRFCILYPKQANEAIPLYNKPQHEYQLSYISKDESKGAYLRSTVDLTTILCLWEPCSLPLISQHR